uniref:Ig-like domain-containing alpha-2-macroglobulin family protein n=1 Tax=Chitinasiproducens palmae TaxID=1770053 RepID=UPI00147A8E00|nr:Ig-like domain-containing alpha-2-macroglobulin family protein [Chitinasiproducens palmae]
MQRANVSRRHAWLPRLLVAAGCLTSLLFATSAHAARIVRVTPEGEVGPVTQVTAVFDEAMVAFGSGDGAAPLTLSCSGAPTSATRGSGRWIDAKTWSFRFDQTLGPGARCELRPSAGLKSAAGQAVTGNTRYAFATGGPRVLALRPGGNVDEDQIFAARMNVPVTERSVQDNVFCEVDGIGERLPVKLVKGADRDAILRHLDVSGAGPDWITFSCQRRLPSGATVRLLWGAGLATAGGVSAGRPQQFERTVRAPLTASFSCERENARAACSPLRPMQLSFTANVPRATLESIVLQTPDGKRKPTVSDNDSPSTTITFPAPLPPDAALSIVLPAGLKDDAGRPLSNAGTFPLAVRTAAMPPLLKFSTGSFGILERFAEPGGTPMLPLTVRHIEADATFNAARVPAAGGALAQKRVDDDAAIIAWLGRLRHFDDDGTYVTEKRLNSIEPGLLARSPKAVRIRQEDGTELIDVRSLSLLANSAGVQRLNLPTSDPKQPRPFEVIGLPLKDAGFYVIEAASPRLGASLLADPRPMYVRTTALVTNLAVHLKQSREGSLVWVTTLDGARPVAGARIRVSSCDGQSLATGETGKDGTVTFNETFPRKWCQESGSSGVFVSARVNDPKTGPDMSFVLSDWDRGIEPWRFNVPTNENPQPSFVAHTVFDRPLFTPGETVSMKHFLRQQTGRGLAVDRQAQPAKAIVRHLGSDDSYELALTWRPDGTAVSTLPLPPQAKLGEYSVSLSDEGEGERGTEYDAGHFRVERVQLPVMQGKVAIGGAPLIAAQQADVSVQLNYLSGGGAAGLPVRVSALARPSSPDFDSRYPGFSFTPYRPPTADASVGGGDEGDDGSAGDGDAAARDGSAGRLIADKVALTLDRQGAGRLKLDHVPRSDELQELVVEADYADPNGQIATLRSQARVWPAGVVAAIRTPDWAAREGKITVQGLALDTRGEVKADVPLTIRAVSRRVISTRRRLVGGFYAYDNRTEIRELGDVCKGRSDSRGLLVCEAKLDATGDVTLIATADDADGRHSSASASVWVASRDEVWFGGDNTDRIDVLADKREYQPGETARFQVRMPFRAARALVTVEREGILHREVVELNGNDPTVQLKISPDWGPNVFVSVLVLRPRVREVPWYSLFTWGWKSPVEWARAFWYEGREYQAPNAFVDLSKPAFRVGVAEISVGLAPHRLQVTVTPDHADYPVRAKSSVKVRVTGPDGRPVPAGTTVAFAAVDQALLELKSNDSWALLDAMYQRRSLGVRTATAQMEVIGRRHFGRKAVPAGGGGGHTATRELFDTLLLWQPDVQLDANGEARITVPLSDALTSFKLVAVASQGADRFGTGAATIRSRQDLQLISGLPALVRSGDQYRAGFTLRNTTERAMEVKVTAHRSIVAADGKPADGKVGGGKAASSAAAPRVSTAPVADASDETLPVQVIKLAANSAAEVVWDVVAPARDTPAAAFDDTPVALAWRVEAEENGAAHARDAIAQRQLLAQSVPLTVRQATLTQLTPAGLSMPIASPREALPIGGSDNQPRGGVRVSLRAHLADSLPGVQRWLRRYPYSCLEQQTSRAIGMGDPDAFARIARSLPVYLDEDGLAAYFPPGEESRASGSEVLTAYLLDIASAASASDRAFTWPTEYSTRMLDGLERFVEGRLKRDHWAPRDDLGWRKLSAIEALSRYGRARPAMVESLSLDVPNLPTSALLDWYQITGRLKDLPDREQRHDEAGRVLRARLSLSGTRLDFTTSASDALWWLMSGDDVNAARLLEATADDAGWRDDMGRMALGLLGRQQQGAWATTNANAWGVVALQGFSRRFESTPVNGTTQASVDGRDAAAGRWGASDGPAPLLINWPKPAGAKATLNLRHDGTGQPWASVEGLAAVPLQRAVNAGYRIEKTVTLVQGEKTAALKGDLRRGDILRVQLNIDAQTPMTWVVVNDPVPAGAVILGSGLGRDSEIGANAAASSRDDSGAAPSYVERGQDGYRAYYAYLPKGKLTVTYTVRLNSIGRFALPPTRVEALYAPDVFGETPNAAMRVVAGAQ